MTNARKVMLAVAAIAVVSAPVALGAGEGGPLRAGERNPTSKNRALTRETQIIANNSTYGTRLSNKSSNGGGAIYGCRSRAGVDKPSNKPCIRASNLGIGRAFEFDTNGRFAGRITVSNANAGDKSVPFTTNATGVAGGLNADRVDSYEGAQLATRFANVSAAGGLGATRGARAAARTGQGVYAVRFDEAVIPNCSFSVTVVDPGGGGFAWVQPSPPGTVNEDTFIVSVHTAAPGGAPSDRAFHLKVDCL